MSQLNASQVSLCAADVALILFGGQSLSIAGTQATATVNLTDLQNAVSAIDAAFDTTLTAATSATSGATTIISYLASTIPAPASGGTAQQKTILACLVLLKRVGLI